jgi:hypothetical protein
MPPLISLANKKIYVKYKQSSLKSFLFLINLKKIIQLVLTIELFHVYKRVKDKKNNF